MKRDQLISYFRNADKTSEVIGARQAGVFIALRELAGRQIEEPSFSKSKAAGTGKAKTSAKRKTVEQKKPDEPLQAVGPLPRPSKLTGDIALTVRIEINLPVGGSQETYDAIFKSIKANLFP